MDFLTILGILGNMTAIALFTSPLPTFWKIYKLKSTQEFSGLPYVATLLNCMLWCLYGLPVVKSNGLLIITINAAGCVLEVFYISLFLTYSVKKERVKVLKMLLAILVFYTILCLVIILATPFRSRKLVVGLLCVIFTISMYTSPLSVMRMVIRTRSVEFMPFTLSLFNFLNGCVWTGYAFVAKDIYIGIPNGLGTLSGVVQLCLYVLYRKATPLPSRDELDTRSLDKAKTNGAASYIQIDKSTSQKQAEQLHKHESSGLKLVSIPTSPRRASPGPNNV